MPPATHRLEPLLPAVAILLACLSPACLGGSSRPTLDTRAALRPPVPPPALELPSVVSHTVLPGETLWRISRAYGADLEEMIAVNGLDESALIHTGQVLTIPDPARLPSEPPASAWMRWPLRGPIHSWFGPRGRRSHDGIDIDGRNGDPIRAAADGEVVVARSWGAYGKTVVLDHGGGVRTLYAHASRLKVKPGERVRAGQTIAEVGRTGNATGSHLHFEIQLDGQAVDPMSYLPPGTTRASSAR